MFRNYRTAMTAFCLAAFVGIFANLAVAETIYDFDSHVGEALIANQPLYGQDGWDKLYTSTDIQVKESQTGWSGKFASLTTKDSNYLVRANDENWSYQLPDDRSFEFSAILQSAGNKFVNWVVMTSTQYSITSRPILFAVYQGDLWWSAWDDGGVSKIWDYKLTLPTTSANVYRMGFEATANGGGSFSVRAFYEDLSAGGDRIYVDNGAAHAATYDDLSIFEGLEIRMSNGDSVAARVDDIYVGPIVPEPSTSALLSAGLIGLLAYAWRKRK